MDDDYIKFLKRQREIWLYMWVFAITCLALSVLFFLIMFATHLSRG